MRRHFTLIYWKEDPWYVGRLREVPGVFSQGKTLAELEDNIQDAFQMMMEADALPEEEGSSRKELEIEV
jgi:predicted RNase H-like HicB family nuclease